MKIKALLIVTVTMLSCGYLAAQDYSRLENIVLNDKADYSKNEAQVLECSNYLLGSPVTALEKDVNHLNALRFIMRWMEGTPDYTFDLDDSAVKATKSDPNLLGIYMASMCQYVITNKDKAEDQDAIKYNSFLTFIKYCEDESKNVKQNKTIKELIKARNENTLKKYLDIDDSGVTI
jgi:hypothetical protein